ncbi:hypothetical protein PHABIO_442 [Pseudomonas phage Phabio]|uniref:Uncharacterized protein n=1 Tax=Pseudomonas phage Phabio TaxID=2006668 RepID=A0A1Y0SZ71_9CAUD|nr:hypothetical protein MZD05_gp442 [Pseudomonas phage Phabio]ARV77073.1 hypothetical protein PHABIO_442 [Pseudomonas phage Phabio]
MLNKTNLPEFLIDLLPQVSEEHDFIRNFTPEQHDWVRDKQVFEESIFLTLMLAGTVEIVQALKKQRDLYYERSVVLAWSDHNSICTNEANGVIARSWVGKHGYIITKAFEEIENAKLPERTV